MTPTTEDDKQQISSLHGFPSNYRNASKPDAVWKQQPTPIVLQKRDSDPPRGNRSAAARHDPYSRLTGSSGASKATKVGNTTASSTLVNSRKKRKVDQSLGGSSTFATTGFAKTIRKGKSRVPLAPEFDDVIILDEDAPSTDDLNLHDTLQQAPQSSSRSYPPRQSSNSSNPLGIQPDGNSTRWVHGQLESDEIESSDIFEVPPRTSNVKQKVARIENQITGPRVDLRTIGKIGGGIKSKMKGKEPARKPDTFDTTTTTIHAATTKERAQPSQQILPLKAVYLGHQYFPENSEGYYLKWDNLTKQLTIRKHNTLVVSFYPNENISSIVHVSEPRPNQLCLIEVQTFPLAGGGRRSVTCASTSKFKPGDSFAGTITLNFDTEDSSWSNDKYDKLILWLKGLCNEAKNIPISEGKKLWENKRRRAELEEVHTERENSTKNEASSQPKPVSRPLKRSVSACDTDDDDKTPPPVTSLVSNSEPVLIVPRPPWAKDRDKPRDNDKSSKGNASPLRRSTRNAPAPKSRSPAIDADEVILVYPQGVPGAVNITNADLSRLAPGEFLNDTLIEFGLKLWLKELEEKDPDLAKQIHVFSSFFYKKLNKKKIEEGYESVRKWTSKFDLFGKKYIIVPINENLHWYLAIIYEPEHMLLHPPPTPTPTTRQKLRQSASQKPKPRQLFKSAPVSDNAAPDDNISPSASTSGANEAMSSASSEAEVVRSISFDFQSQVTITTDETTIVGPGAPVEEITGVIEEGIPMVVVDDDLHPSSPLTPIFSMVVDEVEPTSDPGSRALSPTASDFGRDSAMGEENTIEEAASSRRSSSVTAAKDHGGIPTSRFYSTASTSKRLQKKAPSPEQLPVDIDIDDDADDSKLPSSRPQTYIFILDSLGTAHLQAVKQLTKYLKLEAKDKKQLEETQTSTAQGKQASVPVQPNYCDCGIYLLHLARTFMTDPMRYHEIILKAKKTMRNAERQVEWNDEAVSTIRERLSDQIKELSTQWKRERAAKEEAKKGARDGQADAETVESSDSDIDIVETTPPVNGKGKPPPRKKVPRMRG